MSSGLAVAVLLAAGCPRPSGPARAPAAPPPVESYFPLAALEDAALCDHLLGRTVAAYAVLADTEPKRRRKVIVSDLHLGPGQNGGPRFAGLEDFFFDVEWSTFLASEVNREPTDLIIAGDFIDFWQILAALDRLPRQDSALQPASLPVLASDQDSALEALEHVLVAHSDVFRQLGQLLARGDHRVIFLSGNHDADLLWPRVRLAIAQAIGARDALAAKRLLFVDAAAYQHGGVYIEHGHAHDAANQFVTAHAPFGRDRDGRCRLQSSWGAIFVDRFFTATERDYPFIDNLYPESAAVLWGLRAEPDVAREAETVARFLQLILAAESRELDATALAGAVRSTLGLPGSGKEPGRDGTSTADEVLAHLADRLFRGGERTRTAVLDALMRLRYDPDARSLWTALSRSAGRLPDVSGALAELRTIDKGALDRLRDLLVGTPMTTAAQRLLAQHSDVSVVVFGHTHVPGGSITRLEVGGRVGYHANSGAWIPVTPVADLEARGVPWTDLSLEDDNLFRVLFPAVVIAYEGNTPLPPRLVQFP